ILLGPLHGGDAAFAACLAEPLPAVGLELLVVDGLSAAGAADATTKVSQKLPHIRTLDLRVCPAPSQPSPPPPPQLPALLPATLSSLSFTFAGTDFPKATIADHLSSIIAAAAATAATLAYLQLLDVPAAALAAAAAGPVLCLRALRAVRLRCIADAAAAASDDDHKDGDREVSDHVDPRTALAALADILVADAPALRHIALSVARSRDDPGPDSEPDAVAPDPAAPCAWQDSSSTNRNALPLPLAELVSSLQRRCPHLATLRIRGAGTADGVCDALATEPEGVRPALWGSSLQDLELQVSDLPPLDVVCRLLARHTQLVRLRIVVDDVAGAADGDDGDVAAAAALASMRGATRRLRRYA
ncbi:hypothetical protein HK405_015574, partial [Cladochytrium tenue]